MPIPVDIELQWFFRVVSYELGHLNPGIDGFSIDGFNPVAFPNPRFSGRILGGEFHNDRRRFLDPNRVAWVFEARPVVSDGSRGHLERQHLSVSADLYGKRQPLTLFDDVEHFIANRHFFLINPKNTVSHPQSGHVPW